MKALSLYHETDSLIHTIDPINKLYYIASAILIPLIINTNEIALIYLFINTIFLILGKVFKKIIPLIGFSIIVLLSIVFIQGLFNNANKIIFINIGPLTFYKEGLIYALKICMRVINIISAFSILILTTKPSDLIEALIRKGLSPKIGYILSSVLQIIPQMLTTMDTISDAQRSRGLETEGKMLTRIKAFIPLMGPVVMNSLITTRERAIALEVRGFNSKCKKSFLNEEHDYKYNKAIKIVIILLILSSIIWRVIS